jgi:hypothetical protein
MHREWRIYLLGVITGLAIGSSYATVVGMLT